MSTWFGPSLDSLQDSHCRDVNCFMLPLGYLLLLMDSYFDVRFVVWPTPMTAHALRKYYTTVLTPTYYWPGYWFPLIAISIMCGVCPHMYNYVLLVLFSLVALRYVGILQGTEDLRYWWTVVVIRIALVLVVTLEWRDLDCHRRAMLFSGLTTEL